MADNETLRLQLEQARQQLHTAQTRVASLEALLTETVLPSASIAHNENNYRILDHLIEGCQIISFDWRYLYLNDSAAFHGRQSKEELLGRTMMECYPGIENTPFFITLRRAMENRSPQSLENEFVYPNGMKKWFELTIQPVPEGVFILSLDITERKRAESQLSESEEWIRLSLEATELGKWRHNILTGIVRFDERALMHYGLDRDTLPIEEFLDHIHPADIDALLQQIGATISASSDGKYTTEYRVVHADGSVHWLAVQARVYFEGEGDARHPVHGFGTTQNITERKRSELALKRYSQRMKILHEMDAGIIEARSTEQLVETTLKHIRQLIPCLRASVILFDYENNVARFFAIDLTGVSTVDLGTTIPIPPPGWLEEFSATKVKVVDDLLALPDPLPAYKQAIKEGMRSFLHVLLTVEGRPIGLLNLIDDVPAFFNAEHEEIAVQIGTQLAIAINQMRLSEALKRHTKSVEDLSQFLNTTLDAFPANTAVLASDGTIIKVNAAWERFADDNDMLVETAYLGDNYLTVCDKSVGAMSQESIPAAAGIREVIDGRRDDFYLEYPCHSPSEKHWFTMRVTPFAEPAPRRVVVAHINTTERKLGELALRESERRFQRMADSAPAMLWTTDETGAVTFTSRGWYEYTGLDEEIGLGFDWLNAVHPEDFAKTDATFAAAIKQPQDYELDYRLRRADGEYRWVVDCGRPLFAADGKFTGYVGSIIDNHERKLAQQELESLYNATSHLFTTDSLANLGQQIVETVVSEFQHADCGLMLVDKAQNRMVRFGRAGNYDLRPDAALMLDGPGLVPLAARTGSAVYAPDVRIHPGYVASEARTRSELAVPLITARGVIAVLDLQRIEIDGFSERDQRVLTAYAERAAAALENMQLYEALEQRVLERTAELKAAKDRVEAILNNSVDGILLVYPDLRIQQANSAFNWLFACETDDYFNKSLLDLVHADDVQRVQAIIAAGSSDGVDRRLEIRAVRSDGKVFDAEFSIGHVKTDGFVCTVRDITERKEQERQLRYHASLQQNIRDAVIATDMEFRIQSWNSAAESMYGWRADEVIGRGVGEVFKTKFESDAERDRITDTFLKQGYWQGEFIQQRK
ncbi:MAG: PAS domain S-box protein, partial [Burkholderiales bacterium]|nr:PAS domain S-box protein [Anaerolineae bacterium]